MPKVWTGNFAQVYELRNSSKRWAVKCFTRSATDIRLRYSEVSRAIAAARLPYFVEFRFIDSEMLVNGRRHPVVKMEWVEGQSLDKHVEANLYQPHVLLGTAEKLLAMVKDLEAQQLAHGDLQHGNIVITPAGLKLVDYDGMFAPSFAGKRAAETGLPSYQHPRRGGEHFGVGLDRFALLVICTGLCAVAVEPGLWYEFYTGDNLLFSGNDFKDPKASKLFRRLAAINDPRLRTFADALRMACVQNPLFASVPGVATLQSSARRTPWWVTLPPDVRPEEAPDTAPAHRPDSPGAMIFRDHTATPRFHHFGAIAVAVIGAAALSVGGVLGPEAGLFSVLAGALGYVLERLRRYNALPALVRQQELRSRLDQLRREVQNEAAKKTTLETQMAGLAQQEQQEKAGELAKLRDAHVSAYLSSIPIAGISSISGIGPYLVGNFQSAGIHSALQLKQRGPYVSGVGPKRRNQILALLSQWESNAVQASPRALPPDVETRIASRYQQQRQTLASQIGDSSRRISASGTHVAQAESELKQLHIPTFRQFVKNTF